MIRKTAVNLLLGLLALLSTGAFAGEGLPVQRFEIRSPFYAVRGAWMSIHIRAVDKEGKTAASYKGSPLVRGLVRQEGTQRIPVESIGPFENGVIILERVFPVDGRVSLRHGAIGGERTIILLPGFLSILPPILAIFLALFFKQVLIALFAGIWLGAFFLAGLDPLESFLRVLDTHLIGALYDRSHISIIFFSLTLGGMVGILSTSGATQGIVDRISKYARSSRSGQISTWFMGIFIFFDDYANSLLVGNTMRPFTDRLGISREKLSYIVDSTAAPVASIALISTWVGYEIGLIEQACAGAGTAQKGYPIFLQTIPFRFYSLFTIFFVFLLGVTLRDFGSMRRAEIRARREGKPLRDGAQPLYDSEFAKMELPPPHLRRWYNALIPIACVILVTLIGLYASGKASLRDRGEGAGLREIIAHADSYAVLMWAAVSGSIVAGLLAMGQKILDLRQTIDAWVTGMRAMLIAFVILVLAWTIGEICLQLHTADYVISLCEGFLSPSLLPLLVFLVSAFCGFSTGTSWGTMAILMPIVIPLALKTASGMEEALSHNIFLGAVGGVLAGASFGDHCSPISDTTILSSMASGADHIDHVRTQLPYALTTAGVSCIVGFLPAGIGMSPLISLPLGALLLVGILWIFGKKSQE